MVCIKLDTTAAVLEWVGRSGTEPNYITETDGRPRCPHSDNPCSGCAEDTATAAELARAVRVTAVVAAILAESAGISEPFYSDGENHDSDLQRLSAAMDDEDEGAARQHLEEMAREHDASSARCLAELEEDP